MMRIEVGSLALIGAVVGGFALIKVGPIVGPINFNRESPLLSEDDEQRARALRIAAERKAEKAAEKRAEAEQKAEEAARMRETRERTSMKTEFGEVYVYFCKGGPSIWEGMKDRAFIECVSKVADMKCPLANPESLASQTEWSIRYRSDGWLHFC